MEYGINFPLNKTNNKWSYHLLPTICIYRSLPIVLRLMDIRKLDEKYCLAGANVNDYDLIKSKFYEIRNKAAENRPFYIGKKSNDVSKRPSLLYFFYDLYNEKLEESIFQNLYIYKVLLLVYQYAKTKVISSHIEINESNEELYKHLSNDELTHELLVLRNIQSMFYDISTEDFSSLSTFHHYMNENDHLYKTLSTQYDITIIVATDFPITKIKFNMNMFDNKLFLQIFSIESLMMCCLDHCKTCPHEIVSEDEFKSFCKNNNMIVKKENLSTIPSNDVIAKYIGLRPKQICKKIRRCENNGLNVSYYLCVNSNSQFYTTKKKKKEEEVEEEDDDEEDIKVAESEINNDKN